MSNSVDPDETAHYEPSHLDLCCLQNPVIIACGSESVNGKAGTFIESEILIRWVFAGQYHLGLSLINITGICPSVEFQRLIIVCTP